MSDTIFDPLLNAGAWFDPELDPLQWFEEEFETADESEPPPEDGGMGWAPRFAVPTPGQRAVIKEGVQRTFSRTRPPSRIVRTFKKKR